MLDYLSSIPKVIMHGNFIGKSGASYSLETDIRYALKDYCSAKKIGNYIYLISQLLDVSFDSFIGVPETGSLLANFANDAKYIHEIRSFPINMLRSTPKEYQLNTNSVNTVLPVTDCQEKFILLEDDIVTGNTVLEYINHIEKSNIDIVAVVTVFSRKDSFNSLRNMISANFGIDLYSIIEVE